MNTELTLDVLIVHIKKRQVVTVRNTQQLLLVAGCWVESIHSVLTAQNLAE